MAVTHGGGVNHRRDLSDKMMLKENHIALLEIFPQPYIRLETVLEIFRGGN